MVRISGTRSHKGRGEAGAVARMSNALMHWPGHDGRFKMRYTASTRIIVLRLSPTRPTTREHIHAVQGFAKDAGGLQRRRMAGALRSRGGAPARLHAPFQRGMFYSPHLRSPRPHRPLLPT